jgi:hypothetical protein
MKVGHLIQGSSSGYLRQDNHPVSQYLTIFAGDTCKETVYVGLEFGSSTFQQIAQPGR